MSMNRRSALAALSLTAALPAELVRAQSDWPSKPIIWVAPFPAGGIVDNLTRVTARKLEVKLGQRVVVDNRPGAAGIVAAQYVARAPADGYTWLVGTSGQLVGNPALYDKLSYNVAKDFTLVHGLNENDTVLFVRSDSPARSVKDLVDMARAKPGALTMASSGAGSLNHMAGELFQREANVKFTHVPYKGSMAGLNDLAGGVVDAMFDFVSSARPLLDGKRLRALTTTGRLRSDSLPDVPTLVELGYPGAVLSGWIALVVPIGTPASVVRRISEATSGVLADPELLEAYSKADARALLIPGGPKLEAFVQTDAKRWRDMATHTGVKLQ